MRFCLPFLLLFLSLVGLPASAWTLFPDSIVWSTEFSAVQEPSGWMNMGQRSTLPDGKSVLVTDSLHPYGAGYEWNWPDTLPARSVLITCEASVRSSQRLPGIQWVLSVEDKGMTLLWEGRDLRAQLTDTGRFLPTRVEFRLPANFLRPENRIRLYLYQPDPQARIETGRVAFVLRAWPLPSYLPTVSPSAEVNGPWKKLLVTRSCSLSFQPATGRVRIEQPDGQPLIGDLSLYTEIEGRPEVSGYRIVDSVRVPDEQAGHGVLFVWSNDFFSTTVSAFSSEPEPGIDWELHTEWHRPVSLVRQAVVLQSAVPAIEAVDGVGRRCYPDVEEECWLGRGAVILGDSRTRFALPYAEHLSSLQVDWRTQRLWLNADWSFDHPLLHWPEEPRSRNHRVDHSCSLYGEGDTLSAKWTIRLQAPAFMPAIQDRPSGYEATFIWTEHADYSDLLLQRALMFGVDSVTDPRHARAGFLARGIPMTKSVFYDNPDRVSNRQRHAGFRGPIASIRSTTGFGDLMMSLEESGIEIALHTPEQFTSTRKRMEEALQFMRSRFGTTTWIDHGYDNAPMSNREDLVCDGLDSTSSHNALDLWQRYGITSLWNCYYEDTNVFAPFTFDSRLVAPYTGISSRFPAPVWWTHPTRSGGLLHWRTTTTLDPPEAGLWSFYLGEQRIDDLVRLHGTYIAHCYPARVDSSNGFYRFDAGHWTIDPAFDEVLALQARYREEKRLWIPVVRDYLRFQQQLARVRLEPSGTGWKLSNGSSEIIRGLTLSASQELSIPGKTPAVKRVGDERYFIFDLGPGETVEVKVQ